MSASDRLCTRVPPPYFHGKERVDGSSPSEGFKKPLQTSDFWVLAVARLGDEGRTRSHAVDFTVTPP
jgi:hypothetical protein